MKTLRIRKGKLRWVYFRTPGHFSFPPWADVGSAMLDEGDAFISLGKHGEFFRRLFVFGLTRFGLVWVRAEDLSPDGERNENPFPF